ncbi:unnamed protein product, partial [Ectocarpus fasciculatus]
SIVHSLSLGELEILENGALVFNDKGIIEKVYNLNDPASKIEFEGVKVDIVHSCTGKLIIPGFVDCHCHAPQYEFTGTGIDVPLMEWLERFTFPCESRFSDVDHAHRVYAKTVLRHLKCGTTFASYFATIHTDASMVLADIIEQLGQRAFVGKVSMDRHCPEFYIEDTAASISDVETFSRRLLMRTAQGAELVRRVDEENEKGEYDPTVAFKARNSLLNLSDTPRVLPCITPRFVPTCTEECMRGIGSVSHRYGLPAQSHLSEDIDEIEFVKGLHEDIENYASVYNEFGLLHSGSMMAHCIHCTDEELNLMKECGAAVIHCPSSNFLLGSGIMDARRIVELGLKLGLGTDVAGGASPSMLDCIRNVVTASRCMGFWYRNKRETKTTYKWLGTQEVFHLATQGGAEAVGMGDVFGNFLPGKKLDCLVVDLKAESGVTDVFSDDVDVWNQLEKFIYVGDDRNIQAVIVDGKVVLGQLD